MARQVKMIACSDNVEFPCGERFLTPRPLSSDELRRDYLPLRFSTLYLEKHWTRTIPNGPLDFLDEYDETAWPFGIYLGHELIAAIRLIAVDSSSQLPSGSFISDPQQYLGRSAEISKAMVDQSLRGCGLFNALLLRCRLEAIASGIDHLFISVIDSERTRTFLRREGFGVVSSPFKFADRTIVPEVHAIILRDLVCDRAELSTDTLSTRLRSMYVGASRKISSQFPHGAERREKR